MEHGFGKLDKLKVFVLAEDSVLYNTPYLAQHGVSFFVQTYSGSERANVLVDVGQNTYALMHNMELMNIDSSTIDAIVLTHCHYDHTRGIAEVLRKIGKRDLPVIAHPDIFRLNLSNDPVLRHVGMTLEDSREKIEESGGRLILARDPLMVFPGLITTGEVRRQTDFEGRGYRLFTVTDNGGVVEDRMMDDISVVGITNSGIVILTGCSHAGIVNIIKHSAELAKEDRVLAVIGGFHLIDASDERIEKTVRALSQMKIDRIYAGHCTGFKAQVELYREFGERFSPLHTGMSFEF
ncbi:MBL fold metallo-hydrolase [Fervidicoccus fontis]|uniref:Beta-lactamase domain protein n=1 Tax=Fervidicoccus fontis (strain DSM 19380 / JCM 18336 / VKM B-2539 / Kam940) TaxID=1163730 RepID=I0A305_FERFK|nr:MBL fold metallo-hydrolase [Fervidicoccus fontis]AFH43362.1 beta-lactamase domain protein [Fervidicoccus fontis Kam940]